MKLSEYIAEAVARRTTGKYNFDFNNCNFNRLIEYLKLSGMDEKDCGMSLAERLHSISYRDDPWKSFDNRFEELKYTYGLDGDFWCDKLVPDKRYIYVFKMGDKKVYTVVFNKSGRSIMYIRIDDLAKRTSVVVRNEKRDEIKIELENIFS